MVKATGTATPTWYHLNHCVQPPEDEEAPTADMIPGGEESMRPAEIEKDRRKESNRSGRGAPVGILSSSDSPN